MMFAPSWERPKSKVRGALLSTNMPYPALLMKNGIGLYMSGVWALCASLVHNGSFWPRLLRRVKDSPQPKSISSGCSEKLAAILRVRSEAVRTNEKGVGSEFMRHRLSRRCWVLVSRSPEASRNIMCQGSRSTTSEPWELAYVVEEPSSLTPHASLTVGSPSNISDDSSWMEPGREVSRSRTVLGDTKLSENGST